MGNPHSGREQIKVVSRGSAGYFYVHVPVLALNCEGIFHHQGKNSSVIYYSCFLWS